MLYLGASVILSKCSEARTLKSVHKTKTAVIQTDNNKITTGNDKYCKDEVEVNTEKPDRSPKEMEGYVACEYFTEYETCETLTLLIKKGAIKN